MQRINTATKAPDLFGPGKHGFKDGNLATGILPTDLEAAWFNGAQEELLSIIEGAGIVADGAVFTQVRQAIKRLAGGNVTTVNFATSPFALTPDHAGLVLIDATAGNVVLNLPAANVLAGLSYEFRRTDATANTVTVNRAGADTIDEGGLSFSVAPKSGPGVRSDGVSKWSTVGGVISTAGTVFFHAGNTAPIGSLKANGAFISRTTYAALFEAIGTTFGAGDGATTFAVPDLRGEFLRGWDDARGVDVGRTLGGAQSDAFKDHQHILNKSNSAGTLNNYFAAGATTTDGSTVSQFAVNPVGGIETRPRNIALLACIKF